jgi:hypothetical protein
MSLGKCNFDTVHSMTSSVLSSFDLTQTSIFKKIFFKDRSNSVGNLEGAGGLPPPFSPNIYDKMLVELKI